MAFRRHSKKCRVRRGQRGHQTFPIQSSDEQLTDLSGKEKATYEQLALFYKHVYYAFGRTFSGLGTAEALHGRGSDRIAKPAES